MFNQARLKLTIWYTLTIVLVSSFFSFLIYQNISGQIEHLIRMQNDRIRNFQFDNSFPQPRNRWPEISTDELIIQKIQLAYTLFIINIFLLTVSGTAGYFLAGQTLHPIKLMIDDQNQFISDASHELRTPIATLQAEMEATLLENKFTPKETKKMITSNLEELSTLKKLANSLLKLTNGHHQDSYQFSDISLPLVVKSACAQVLPLAKQKNITFILKTFKSTIKGDKDSLIEVFIIFLDNAIKYSQSDTKIKIIFTKIKNHRLKVSIIDQGIGIKKEDLPHIFDRFFRADKSRSLTDGFGLGLPIAKKIIDHHHGSISVDSKLGHGSTFAIVLPLSSN